MDHHQYFKMEEIEKTKTDLQPLTTSHLYYNFAILFLNTDMIMNFTVLEVYVCIVK